MDSVAALATFGASISGFVFFPAQFWRNLQVMSRVPGVTVTPHHGRIEEKPLDFYEQFHVIILGLDSLEARRYMNSVACSLLGRLCAPTKQMVRAISSLMHAWQRRSG